MNSPHHHFLGPVFSTTCYLKGKDKRAKDPIRDQSPGYCLAKSVVVIEDPSQLLGIMKYFFFLLPLNRAKIKMKKTQGVDEIACLLLLMQLKQVLKNR